MTVLAKIYEKILGILIHSGTVRQSSLGCESLLLKCDNVASLWLNEQNHLLSCLATWRFYFLF
jgi:hypothetical protein